MSDDKDNSDFEDRAAIREYLSGQPRGTAEFFAREEIGIRKAKNNINARRKKYKEDQEKQSKSTKESKQPKKEIQALINKHGAIGDKMRAEKDPEQQAQLFKQWFDLCTEINKLRKES